MLKMVLLILVHLYIYNLMFSILNTKGHSAFFILETQFLDTETKGIVGYLF